MAAKQEGDEGWEDDEMDELFSFGTTDIAGAPGAGAGAGADADSGGDMSPPVMVEQPDDSLAADTGRERAGSDDSFLEMLDEETTATATALDTTTGVTGAGSIDDAETQEILSWLDNDQEDDKAGVAAAAAAAADDSATTTVAADGSTAAAGSNTAAAGKSSATTTADKSKDTNGMKDESSTRSAPVIAPTVVAIPPTPPPPPKPTFDTLEAALLSTESTNVQIRELFANGGMKVSDELRPELWSRIVCNKTLDDLLASSNADSYVKWKETADHEKFKNERSLWIKTEAPILAERITCMKTPEEAQQELTSLLLFYYMGNAQKDMDPLVPPVACTILSAGLAPEAASVVLSNIMPSFMPLLALTQEERLSAAHTLHTQFYLLACYHLPLLVFHLDRYAPGWHWPKVLDSDKQDEKENEDDGHAWRHLEKQGVVPQSWLISHLAGECHGTLMNPMWLLSLWDLILTSSNNSLRFFLSLAVLEKHSDTLLMITGEKLVLELNRIMEFKEGTTLEGFAIEGDEETTASEAVDWVQEWCSRARSLWESTPRSVVSRLRRAEDEAVSHALHERQRKAEEELQAKLESEAKAHKEAMENEKERRAEEGRTRLNKARLSAYYKKYNPEKEGNVDKIMVTFAGRLDVLDARLKAKYGQGFNAALKPVPLAKNTSKLLSTMNQGLTNQRKRIATALQKRNDENGGANSKQIHEVTVRVSPNEVLPIICWAKEADSYKKASSRPCDALKYYLVDSRPEETAREQGGFPTALAMSPEALLDPDRMKEQEDIFESLRGAAHIVVMGEGFSAVTSLYGQKSNPSLSQLVEEDDSRTNLCALFFVKKGFPFVSILEGGFCGAHAWLSREGPKRHLNVNSVLVDYMGEASMFGQLEKAHREQKEFANASTSEKTTMALQGLFDKSMTSLTRNASRLENLASTMEVPSQPAAQLGATRFTKFFKADEKKEESSEGTRFRNPFKTEASPVPSPKTTTPATGASGPSAESSDSFSFDPVIVDQPDAVPKASRFVAMGAARLGGIGSALNSSIAKIAAETKASANTPATPAAATMGQTYPPAQENRFASFGASLTKAVKNTTATASQQPLPNVLKRNPFARFGGAQQPQQQQQPKTSRFGMNNFSNRLAGLRTTTTAAEQQDEAVIDFN